MTRLATFVMAAAQTTQRTTTSMMIAAAQPDVMVPMTRQITTQTTIAAAQLEVMAPTTRRTTMRTMIAVAQLDVTALTTRQTTNAPATVNAVAAEVTRRQYQVHSRRACSCRRAVSPFAILQLLRKPPLLHPPETLTARV